MKADTTVNGPQTSPKTASTVPRQVATSRKRDEGEIAPRKPASGGRAYDDGAGGSKWEMSVQLLRRPSRGRSASHTRHTAVMPVEGRGPGSGTLAELAKEGKEIGIE